MIRGVFTLTILLAGVWATHAQTNFTASVTSGCAPLVVQFTSTVTGTVAGYSWTFGNTGSSVLQNPSTTYTAPGTYTVVLTTSGPAGTTVTKTNYITVYAAPTISFSMTPTAGCAPLSVHFSSTVTPNSPGTVLYNWDYGDGYLGSGASPTHSYTTATGSPFSVTLTATNGAGCTNSVVMANAVTVYPKPTATFSSSQTTYCSLPAVVNFLSSTTGGTGTVNVAWRYGDGSIGAGNNPVHTYTTAGTFTVTMFATDAQGCIDSVVQNAYITTQPNNAAFSGPTTGCNRTDLRFFNTTAGGGTAVWDFGDGSLPVNGDTTTHSFVNSGTYTVQMVTQVGPCYDTVRHTIVINPRPAVTISHDVICLPGVMQFTAASSVTPATYSWAWASGGSATGNPVTHAYSGPRIDTTYLIVASSATGCTDTVRMDTTYVKDYIPNLTWRDKGCIPLNAFYTCLSDVPCSTVPCAAKHLPLCACSYPYNFVSYTWWIDGVLQTATGRSINTTYTTSGAHSVVLKTVTANGCVRYDTMGTCAGQKIPPSFTYTDTVVCVKQGVAFTNTTGVPVGVGYTWLFGENDTTANLYNGFHRYRVPGVYTVSLVSEICGCADTVTKTNLILVNPSNAQFRDSVLCPPSKTVYFMDTSIGATTHLWTFGDGSTSTVQNPVHTYANYGKYFVTQITWNSTYGCRDTVLDSVVVANTSMGFAASDTTLCLGDTLHLVGNYSGLPYCWWQWVIDGDYSQFWCNGYINRLPCVSTDTSQIWKNVGGLATGYHTVSMIIKTRLGQCTDSVRKNNYVIVAHPVAGFKATPRLGCTPLPVLFTDTSSYTSGTQPASRHWVFGNGDTATNNNASTSYTYTTAGVYTIKLKVTDWIGCTDSLTKTGYVEARHPSAYFSVNNAGGCIGKTFSFTNQSSGATMPLAYSWTFGDGGTSTSASPVHTYTATGAYTVRLIATDSSGCSDTFTRASYINITRPVAAFTASDSISVCPPLIVTFTSTSVNAAAHAWTFNNGSTSSIANPATTFSNPGVYNVRLIVTDAAGCMDTATKQLRVLGYAGALSYTPLAGCVPLTVNFTANISKVPYMVWDFSDGDTALAVGVTTFTHTYLTPGAYVPKLIFYDGKGCSASSTGLDTIKVDDVIAGFKALPPCERSQILMVDTSHSLFSPVTGWLWDFGGGQMATGQRVPRVYPAAGSYPVTLMVTNARGCKDTLTRNVTIYPLPIVTASPDTVVCPPDAVPITATGALSYAWSPAGSLSCSLCTTPKAGPTVPTSYLVIGTDTNGCANHDSVRIGIQTKTTFSVNASGEICLGQRYQLSAGGATLYSWTPAESLDDPNGATPKAQPTVTTTYIATGREGSCAVDTHSVRVVVNPLPTVDAGKDERMVAGGSVALQASGTGIDHLEWKADPTLSCTTCYGPYASPRATTVYYLTAYTTKGCAAVDSVTVRVLCDNSQLFIPNSFTPNSDGVNDYFYVQGKGIDVLESFRVYSRWGELLFERKGMNVNSEHEGWNGTYGGKVLSPDVYVYIIEAKCENGESIRWKGDVTLIR